MFLYNSQAPQPADPWIGTLDAFKFGSRCIQYVTRELFEGDEDCLNLNVYVPTKTTSIDANAKLPVMFYIYGGAFNKGSSVYFAPDFLMDENIIVVSRL